MGHKNIKALAELLDAVTPQQQQGVNMFAEGTFSHVQISLACGVSRMTVQRWREEPVFMRAVAATRKMLLNEVREMGIAVKMRRLKAMNDRWERLQRIMDERAKDSQWAEVAGWKTGLLVHDVKTVGEDKERVNLFKVDTGLLSEMRTLERDAAEEMGQRTMTVVRKDETSVDESPKASMDWLKEARERAGVNGNGHANKN